MALWRDRMNYVHEVNAYVNSRHPQPAISIYHNVEAADPGSHHSVHPGWKAALDRYHAELDRLREDWALEVLGRQMQKIVYFGHRYDPYAITKGLQTLPWYIPDKWFVKAYLTTYIVWRYWEFHVKEQIYPLSWKPLRKHYTRRMDEIDSKYCDRLGVHRQTFRHKKAKLFPTDIFILLHHWQPFYSGQDNLRTEVRWVSTPPVGPWDIRTRLVGMDETLFVRFHIDRTGSRISSCVDAWIKSGFEDIVPEGPLDGHDVFQKEEA